MREENQEEKKDLRSQMYNLQQKMTKDRLKLTTEKVKSEMKLKLVINSAIESFKHQIEKKALQSMTSDHINSHLWVMENKCEMLGVNKNSL